MGAEVTNSKRSSLPSEGVPGNVIIQELAKS